MVVRDPELRQQLRAVSWDQAQVTDNGFVSQTFPAIFHIPGYSAYLVTADDLPTDQFFSRQLQVMRSQGKHWFLDRLCPFSPSTATSPGADPCLRRSAGTAVIGASRDRQAH